MRAIRILVIEDVELEAKLLTRTLADRGYASVVWAKDAEAAVKVLEEAVPTIAIVDLTLGRGPSGIDVLMRVRANDAGPYVYAIVLTAHASDDVVRKAFEAGADGFLVKPFRAADLASRLLAAERTLERDAALRAMTTELEAALRQVDPAAAGRARAKARARESVPDASGPVAALIESMTWADMSAQLEKGLVEFVGVPFARALVADPGASTLIAEAHLSEPDQKIEVGLAVVIDGANASRLAVQMLGEETDVETACGLVLECANVLLGALKVGLTERGYACTAGLPSKSDAGAARAAYDQHPIRQRFAFGSDGLHLEIWVRVAESRATRVRVRDLAEGMVVTEDVRDPRGMLLLRAGSRLTETTAERIRRLGPEIEISVQDAPRKAS